MNRLIIFFVALVMTQFSYAQQQLTIEEMEDSMSQGNLNIQVELGIEYIEGERVAKDYCKAISLIRDAAEKGNRYGQLILGVCYEDGIGVEKNLNESFRLFQRSAEQGNVSAMNRVAVAYHFGKGVPADIQQAIKYYRMSAEKGHFEAQFTMGLLYEHGDGVERDMTKAFEWNSLAAQQHGVAKILQARDYFNGWGTERNKAEALRLLESLKDDEELGKVASQYCSIIEHGDTMNTYEFQFRWIPNMLFEWQKGNAEDAMLTDIFEWQLQLGGMFISHYDWDWSAVSSRVYPQSNDIDIIVYRMPTPQTPPLCQYAAAVINRKLRSVQYFTLELSVGLSDKSSSKSWMFCGVGSNMSHLNYGFFKDAVTEKNFVKKLKQHVVKQEVAVKKEKKKKKRRSKAELIQEINDSICAEGYNLYIAETINWVSTDSVLAHYHREDLGGSLIWQPTDTTWNAIFYDKEGENCIFELNYSRINKTATISYEKRSITETEQNQINLKQTMLQNAMNNYGNQMRYDEDCGNPNIEFIRINDSITRMYMLQGTVHSKTIPFGNDYSVDFDNEGNALCFRKYHNSLIAMNIEDKDGMEVQSVAHTHLRDNPYITPTDVCNFLLYRGPLKECYILSPALDGYIIYDAESKSAKFVKRKQMNKLLKKKWFNK